MPYKKVLQRAFTLIELLVVIVVVGVLIAILIPAFTSMRTHARTALCINDLKQIGVAFYLYLDEHNDVFPAGGGGAQIGDNYDSDNSWEARLFPYVDDRAIFRCPLARTDEERYAPGTPGYYYGGGESGGGYAPGTPGFKYVVSGRYGYNGFLGGGTGSSRIPPKTLSEVKTISNTILCVDAMTGEVSSTTCSKGPQIDYRHMNGANILFVSGAVNWISETVIKENIGYGGSDRAGGWWGWNN